MPKEYKECVQRLMADGKTKAEAQESCAIAFYKKHGRTPQEAENMGELTVNEKREKLEAALNPTGDAPVYAQEIRDDLVVINDKGKTFEVPYKLAEDGAVTLGGRKEVKVTYESLAELQNVEIIKTGNHVAMNGTKITLLEADIDEMIKNAGELKDQMQPPMVVSHADGNMGMVINAQTVGAPQVGWMDPLSLVKKKNDDDSVSLFANFKDIARNAVDKIGTELKRLSAEFYQNYKAGDRNFGKVIRRVSFVPLPSIKDMGDVTKGHLVFGEQPDQPTTWVPLSEAAPQSKPVVKDPPPVKREETNMDIAELGEKVITLTEGMEKLQEAVVAKDAQIATLEAERTETTTKLSDVEAQHKKNDITRFCTDRMREGRISPALLKLGLEQFMAGLDDSEVTRFGEGEKTMDLTPMGFMKKIFMSIPKNSLVRFGEIGAAGGDAGEGFTASDRLTEATTKILAAAKKDNKVIKYAEAFEQAQKDSPDLAAQYQDELGQAAQ